MFLFTELLSLILNKQFDKLHAIINSLPGELTSQQKKDEDNNTLLHYASLNYHAPIQTLKLLYEKGCSLKDRNNDNDLPIHYAALNNHVEAVDWMLSVDGTLINDKGDDERTPLHYAAYNNKEIVRLLLSKGADVNAVDKDGKKADELSDVNEDIRRMIREYRHW